MPHKLRFWILKMLEALFKFMCTPEASMKLQEILVHSIKLIPLKRMWSMNVMQAPEVGINLY